MSQEVYSFFLHKILYRFLYERETRRLYTRETFDRQYSSYKMKITIFPVEIKTFPGLQSGALCKATKLRKLYITAYNGVKNFNFPNILEYNNGLRHLVIDVRVKFYYRKYCFFTKRFQQVEDNRT